MTTNDERRLLEQGDAVVELVDFDYGNLLLDPGNPAYIAHFTADPSAVAIELDGVTYEKMPLEFRGVDVTTKGAPPRPSLIVGNADGVVAALIDTIGGSIVGARITRRRIYSRFLDGGATPDPNQQWEPQTWNIERKKDHTRFAIRFELSAGHDIQGLRIPGRIVEATLCPFRYIKGGTGGIGTECTWDPSAGPYFDENGLSSTQANDMCGLRYTDCEKRFGARDEALRYGAFVAVGRSVR